MRAVLIPNIIYMMMTRPTAPLQKAHHRQWRVTGRVNHFPRLKAFAELRTRSAAAAWCWGK
jgi:hypothetical protein